mmetsp:Transcript_14130/g.30795  ORF Transcript_14130/g.30795 Transcript_14130/m.30795 type:complete len:932 (+) Transcript_14130:71-2866(+)
MYYTTKKMTRTITTQSWTTVAAAVLLLLLSSSLIVVVEAAIPCFSIFDCKTKVGDGSVCERGTCTNPFFRGGCLANQLKDDHHRVRTCHSEDPPEAAENGYCRPSTMDYVEVRIASQNWESVFFEAWILQILLSEFLDVPVTIETGRPGLNVDFYDLETRFDYGGSNDWTAMRTANEYQDCTQVKKLPGYYNSSEAYVSCSHVIPEVWTGHTETLKELQEDEIIDPPAGLGALGSQGWYIPRFTAKENPELLTYLGMQGDENREKLARIFKRPTTWEDYCKDESPTNCTSADGVATRPPTDAEKDKYYAGADFIGHFRNTTENDCDNNANCTGHIVDYPCGWSSYVPQQAHHLKIAVESNGKEPGSNGYSYGAMTQIWAAANATKSNVMLHWWQPEALYQEYLGSEAEFQRVSLPPPTQDCVEQRVPVADRCADSFEMRVGDAAGSCDEQAHVLYKVINKALYDLSYNPEVPSALHSPAYETIKDFRISDLQLGRIFDYWFESAHGDKWGLDPREAVCRWVIENRETLESYIPRTHPRLVEENDGVYEEPMFYVAQVLAAIAMAFTLVTMVVTYLQREKPAIRLEQIEFLFLLLVGLLLVSFGSLLNALPPQNALCVSVAWFVNLGYTLSITPLIVKIAAINRLMLAAQQMRRVELRLGSLYGAVVGIAALVMIGLSVWTIIDPPKKNFELSLTSGTSDFGETVVDKTYFCRSDAQVWHYLGVSWQALLLLSATVLAFQSRKMSATINDTRSLAMVIYSQFVFVVLRAITYFVDSSLEPTSLAAARSFLYSADVVAMLTIYFIPKFFRDDTIKENVSPLTTTAPQGAPNSNPRNASYLSGSARLDPGQRVVVGGRVRNLFSLESSNVSEVERHPTHMSPLAQAAAQRDAEDDDVARNSLQLQRLPEDNAVTFMEEGEEDEPSPTGSASSDQ